MADLRRLSAEGVPTYGGFVMRFPSGTTKVVHWQTGVPISPELEAAKGYAAEVIASLSAGALFDDRERTNWASAVAAIQQIVMEFNEELRAHLHAQRMH